MDEATRIEKRIDRVHADIKRNPHMRSELAPFLRELENELHELISNECKHTCETYVCARPGGHPGAHIALNGEWWPYAWEGTHYIGTAFKGRPVVIAGTA